MNTELIAASRHGDLDGTFGGPAVTRTGLQRTTHNPL
jgi:hypothetical protein